MCVLLPPHELTPPVYLWRDVRPWHVAETPVVIAPPRKPVTPPPAALLLPFAPSRRFVTGFGVAVAIGWTLYVIVAVFTLAIRLAGGAP